MLYVTGTVVITQLMASKLLLKLPEMNNEAETNKLYTSQRILSLTSSLSDVAETDSIQDNLNEL